MNRTLAIASLHRLAFGAIFLLAFAASTAAEPVDAAPATPAAALRAHFAAARERIQHSPLGQPIELISVEEADRLAGDVYSMVDHPFGELRSALAQAKPWCRILILHLNVKYCRASSTASSDSLTVGVGRKFDQPLEDVYWVDFTFRAVADGDAFLSVLLQAPSGPMSTHDYRIVVEAVPLDEHHSLPHMSYAYGYGTAARWAMRVYLATLGRDKIGFSVVGRAADGSDIHVGGVRGAVERNTMRYYLAIDAYLGTLALPEDERLPRSLRDWFAATERYPSQLHEIDLDAYLQMKQREVQRQESAAAPPLKR